GAARTAAATGPASRVRIRWRRAARTADRALGRIRGDATGARAEESCRCAAAAVRRAATTRRRTRRARAACPTRRAAEALHRVPGHEDSAFHGDAVLPTLGVADVDAERPVAGRMRPDEHPIGVAL